MQIRRSHLLSSKRRYFCSVARNRVCIQTNLPFSMIFILFRLKIAFFISVKGVFLNKIIILNFFPKVESLYLIWLSPKGRRHCSLCLVYFHFSLLVSRRVLRAMVIVFYAHHGHGLWRLTYYEGFFSCPDKYCIFVIISCWVSIRCKNTNRLCNCYLLWNHILVDDNKQELIALNASWKTLQNLLQLEGKMIGSIQFYTDIKELRLFFFFHMRNFTCFFFFLSLASLKSLGLISKF